MRNEEGKRMNKIVRNFINEVNKKPSILADRKIIAMVDNDVVQGDEFSIWRGDIYKIDYDKIYQEDERVYFNSKMGDIEDLKDAHAENIYHDLISKGIDDGEIACNYDIDKMAEEYVNELNWEKVVVFYIGV